MRRTAVMGAEVGKKESVTSAYDSAAATFDRHRALPDRVAPAVRSALLSCLDPSARPRLLDLGAGTGRIGWPFVAAGDDYTGVDFSLGMLHAFLVRAENDGRAPRLVQADGQLLPFRDATFDAVMLIQVFGGMRGWRPLVAEARRVLRPAGALVVGRSAAPTDGLDAQMKQRLAAILGEMDVPSYQANPRDDVEHWLASVARSASRLTAAAWSAERTARGFLDRHRTGASFSALPAPIKQEALRRLSDWAAASFGSLDAVLTEPHAFELKVFRFRETMDG